MDRYVPLPPLPPRIGRLNELAYDLWWSWNPGAREVFRDLDYPLWRFTDHNPVLLLHLVEPERLELASGDESFLKLYDEAVAALDAVRSGAGTWWAQRNSPAGPIAWITPRFALHQSLPGHVNSLAVASGDFAKEASDLGVPFVGVGLMYPRAYRHQRLTPEGWQQEAVEYIDWSDAPITPAKCADGSPCEFSVPVGGIEIGVAVWQVCAGRSRIYLLDTDVTGNSAWDRELSARHCDGDVDSMLRQSVLLAGGSVEALERLGVQPSAWYLAGAQAALVLFERLNRLASTGVRFLDAAKRVRETTSFVARTDVPSTDDSVAFAAVERHLVSTWPALLPHRHAILGLGQQDTDRATLFNGAVLAARQCGAVRIGGEGVHLPSWISAEVGRLFDTYVSGDWRDRQEDEELWRAIDQIPSEELWNARQRLRGYLVDFMRERARRRWAREQASGSRLVALGTLFDANSLTIGVAPRFGDGGTDVLFSDLDRLARLVTAARHPVQIVIAGRVAGGDENGKHQLQRAFRHTVDSAFGGRVAFIEDYDLHVARLMVQGCDVWLALPPQTAGPSLGAFKAATNGVPLVGPTAAWPSGMNRRSGWVAEDARTLYSVIEEQIVPAFYDRDRSNIPERWITVIRATLAQALPGVTARQGLMPLAASPEILG